MLFWLKQKSAIYTIHAKGIIALVVMCAASSMFAAGQDVAATQRYYSPTEFTLEFPRGWDTIDKTNVSTLEKELIARETELSPEYSSAWRAALRKVMEQRCSAVIWDATDLNKFKSVEVLVSKKEIPLKLSSEKLIQAELLNNLLPSGLLITSVQPALRNAGKRQYLSLYQKIEPSSGGTALANQCFLLKGNKRSLLISCTADTGTLKSLHPVLTTLLTSLRDVRQVNRGLLVLPQWLELSFIGLFALIVVIMIRKTVNEYNPGLRSRFGKSSKVSTLGFIAMVVVVWLLLVGATLLFKI